MKRVGIISMQRIVNHGSFLQAYGLKKTIENNIPGTICEYIDLPVKKINKESVKYGENFLFFIKRIRYKLLGYDTAYNENKQVATYSKLKKKYRKQLYKYLGMSYERNYRTDYDTVVIGSDEVFNCTQEDAPWGNTMLLFGDNVESDNIISYAASFGYTTKERLKEFGLYNKVLDNLRNFKAISVRDRNSIEIVQEMLGEKPYFHLDPVLIYDFNHEIINVKKRKYIVVYQYVNRISDEKLIAAIKNFAKEKNLSIISVFEYCDWADKNYAVNSFEAMGYVKNAAYVVTDTFHGCVMSIKFNKRFIALRRDSNANKLCDLLETFQLQDHIVHSEDDIISVLNKEDDWSRVNQIIDEQKAAAVNYLKQYI